jgi:hypothetical protein
MIRSRRVERNEGSPSLKWLQVAQRSGRNMSSSIDASSMMSDVEHPHALADCCL